MRYLSVGILAAALTGAAHAQEFALRVVQQTGDPVPGVAGASITRLNAPASSPSGALAFPIEFSGGGCPMPRCFAVLHRIGSSAQVVAATGAVLGPSNVRISGQADRLSINDAGRVAFATAYQGGDCRSPGACIALVLHENGRNRLVAWQDGPAPGSNGGIFNDEIRFPALNNRGQLVFEASYQRGNCSLSGSCGGVYQMTATAVQPVAVWQQPVPGFGSARFYDVKAPAINSRGDFAVLATATGECAPGETLCFGILRLGGSPAVVAWQGREAAGTDRGRLVGGKGRFGFGAPAINNAGMVAYVAEFAGGTCMRGACAGVFASQDGKTRLVTSSGRAAPGSSGGVLEEFSSPVALNDAGAMAFHAVWSGGSCPAQRCVGVFSVAPDGSLGAVALRGQAVPGNAAENFEGVTVPSMDDRGVIAFAATSTAGTYRLFVAERTR